MIVASRTWCIIILIVSLVLLQILGGSGLCSIIICVSVISHLEQFLLVEGYGETQLNVKQSWELMLSTDLKDLSCPGSTYRDLMFISSTEILFGV